MAGPPSGTHLRVAVERRAGVIAEVVVRALDSAGRPRSHLIRGVDMSVSACDSSAI